MTDDAETVFPDRSVELSDGATVIVRQLRAAEEDRYHADVVSIRKAVRELIGHSDDEATITEAFHAILDDHGPSLSRLVRVCCGFTDDDWASLSMDDVALLKITWLGVHLRPFAQQHMMLMAMARAASGGARSPQLSSGADTPETPET